VTGSDQPSFALSGRVRRPGAVTAAALAALTVQEVAVRHQRRGQVLPERRHRGILLFDLLRDAGLDGEPGPYPYVNLYVVARGDDGASVVFSVGEIDPAFGAGRLLLAGGEDGQPWRLVAADDRAGARSIRGLASVEVRHSEAGSAPQPPRAHRPQES
jgi:hypothetical protein